MRNREDIKKWMDELQSTSDKEIRFDEEAIMAAYQEKSTNQQSLPIKILSIFGGIMACLAFLGFLAVSHIIDSGTSITVLGIICIIGSVFVSRTSKKIIMDTLCVSFFITGLILFGAGILSEMTTHTENSVYIAFIIIALCTLSLAQNYILSFVSILIINGCMIAFTITNHTYGLIPFIIIFQAAIITFLFLQEAKIITTHKAFVKLYDPIRIGMVLSFLFTFGFLSVESFIHISTSYDWIPSIVIIPVILYVISILFKNLGINNTTSKIIIYVLSILMLSPTIIFPAISGAMLIILLSFLVNYRTGLATAIIALIYFIGKFYYDLHYTLLTKSLFLMISGILFLAIYFFTHKKLTSNEKI